MNAANACIIWAMIAVLRGSIRSNSTPKKGIVVMYGTNKKKTANQHKHLNRKIPGNPAHYESGDPHCLHRWRHTKKIVSEILAVQCRQRILSSMGK